MATDRLTLSVSEAARELGVGKNTAYDLIRANRLPHLRIGRNIRIPRQALETWLQHETDRQ
jgi:excisionase family DNA binding protein